MFASQPDGRHLQSRVEYAGVRIEREWERLFILHNRADM